MNWDDYQRRFQTEAAAKGFSPSRIREYLVYARRLTDSRLPIIYDAAHLCALLGFEEAGLQEALREPPNLYRAFSIPKRSGGFRRIHEPHEPLKSIQLWILRNIIQHQPAHSAATAFIRGRSIKDNAAPHVNRCAVLSLDASEFFDSVRERDVRVVFSRLGYAPSVVEVLLRCTTLRGGLPQGAPTSPALSNLVMRACDKLLAQFAEANRLAFTRYADDFTFSSERDPRMWVGRTIREVRAQLGQMGIRLNESKTRLMLRHQRQEVTGVIVNTRINTRRSVRRKLRQLAYLATKHGLADATLKSDSLARDPTEHVRGVAEFVHFIEPSDRDALAAIRVFGRVRY